MELPLLGVGIFLSFENAPSLAKPNRTCANPAGSRRTEQSLICTVLEARFGWSRHAATAAALRWRLGRRALLGMEGRHWQSQ